MKIFEFAGVIFNANNICTIQKVNLTTDEDAEKVAGIQIVTQAGGFNFNFESKDERDKKFVEIFNRLEVL